MNLGARRNAWNRPGDNMREPRRKGGLVQMIITGLMVIALVVTLVYCVPSVNYRHDVRALFVERIQRECDEAVNACKYLSRTASSNTNAQLALIRSNVYSIQILNETYASLEGGGVYMLSDASLTAIFESIDAYYTRMTTGNNTSDQQTQLSTLLDTLQAAAAALN